VKIYEGQQKIKIVGTNGQLISPKVYTLGMLHAGRLLRRPRALFFAWALGVLCLFSFYSVQHTQTLSRPSAPLLHPSPTKKSALKEKEELVIVTGASDNHFEVLRNLLQTIITFQPSAGIIIYDLGLPIESSKELADWCLDQQVAPFSDSIGLKVF